jgi:hypothetical protein
LQDKREEGVAWLERAVHKNPNNKFAKAVLARMRRGEDKPFARDVTNEELEGQ